MISFSIATNLIIFSDRGFGPGSGEGVNWHCEDNKKGGRKLIVNGHQFNKYGSGIRKSYHWLCRHYQTLGYEYLSNLCGAIRTIIMFLFADVKRNAS